MGHHVRTLIADVGKSFKNDYDAVYGSCSDLIFKKNALLR